MSYCFKAVPIEADSTVIIQGSKIGGFIPTEAGTWAFTLRQENTPDVVLPAINVQAGNIGLLHKLPIFVGTIVRSTLTTAGGAAGILLVS